MADEKWADEEIKASIEAYLSMLDMERRGRPYNKSAINRELRDGPLGGRSKASLEYRMQNISAVMEDLGLERIKGYVPAKNVGPSVKAKIVALMKDMKIVEPEDFKPTGDPTTFEKRVKKLRGLPLAKPAGAEKPAQSDIAAKAFVRDPKVKAWVLERAKGICEACDEPAPFHVANDEPFLEVHHVRWLSQGGSDRVENAVALCPNCHRRCHLSQDRNEFGDKIYAKVERLIRE